jgi:hypothetical protein
MLGTYEENPKTKMSYVSVLGMDAEVENLEACFVKLHCPEDQMITEYL